MNKVMVYITNRPFQQIKNHLRDKRFEKIENEADWIALPDNGGVLYVAALTSVERDNGALMNVIRHVSEFDTRCRESKAEGAEAYHVHLYVRAMSGAMRPLAHYEVQTNHAEVERLIGELCGTQELKSAGPISGAPDAEELSEMLSDKKTSDRVGNNKPEEYRATNKEEQVKRPFSVIQRKAYARKANK